MPNGRHGRKCRLKQGAPSRGRCLRSYACHDAWSRPASTSCSSAWHTCWAAVCGLCHLVAFQWSRGGGLAKSIFQNLSNQVTQQAADESPRAKHLCRVMPISRICATARLCARFQAWLPRDGAAADRSSCARMLARRLWRPREARRGSHA